jgi:hypothetical protein
MTREEHDAQQGLDGLCERLADLLKAGDDEAALELSSAVIAHFTVETARL